MSDGTLVYVENCGVRLGPPAVMARLARGEPVDPAEVYFRSAPRFARPTGYCRSDAHRAV